MKKIYTIAVLLSVCCAVRAQSINQSVQVSNQYESRLGEVRKMSVDISTPDSLTRFDYKFDYSVFDTEYKGAYEFSPYFIQMKPDPSTFDGRKGYLRLGAGFLLHPELEFVYAPFVNRTSAMSIYADAGGYVQAGDDYDMNGRVGLEGIVIGKRAVFRYGVGYSGIFDASSYYGSDIWNSADASIGVRSLREGSYFHYDVNLGYRYGAAAAAGFGTENEHMIRLHGSAGPVIRNRYRLLVDFDIREELLGGFAAMSRTYAGLLPHLLIDADGIRLDLGARLDYQNNFRITPYAEAGYSFFEGSTYVYAGYSGGQIMNSYASLKAANSRFNLNWLVNEGVPELAGLPTYEKMNAFAGVKGHVGTFFQYALKGGYAHYDDRPMFSIRNGAPAYVFEDLSMVYLDLVMAVKTGSVNVSGGLHLNAVDKTAHPLNGYLPSLLSGTLDAGYTWNGRIETALLLDARTAQNASPTFSAGSDIPGFVDFGIRAGYRFSSRMGFWARGGNLMCMEIQRIPGYVEKGPYVTVGFSWLF